MPGPSHHGCIVTDWTNGTASQVLWQEWCHGVLHDLSSHQIVDIVPCLNRRYAQAHGLGFVHASMPALSLSPPGSTSARQHFHKAVRRLMSVCSRAGADLPTSTRVCEPNLEMSAAHAQSARSLAAFASCPQVVSGERAFYRRSRNWCKQALLAEAVAHLQLCSWVVFLDADVLLDDSEPPLPEQPQLKDWLNDQRNALFTAREVTGAWAEGSAKDAPHHRNTLRNTFVSSGFLMASRRSLRALSDWFCAPVDACNTTRGGAGCYRVDWPQDQSGLFSTQVHGHSVTVARHVADYNTPAGKFAQHFWFKEDAPTLARVRALAVQAMRAKSADSFRCLRNRHASGACVGFCPFKVPSGVCRSMCLQRATCRSLMYNIHGECYLKKSSSIREADSPVHGTVACAKETSVATLAELVGSLDVTRRSIVIVGAHHFGNDFNDPIYRSVRAKPWSQVLLIEASPMVARELNESITSGKGSVFSGVPAERMHVANVGVCPKSAADNMPFYTFTKTGKEMPLWSTQIGSFHRGHLEKHFPMMGQSPRWLNKHIRTDSVSCGPLTDALRDFQIAPPAVLQLDIEGEDCKVVATQNWCDDSLAPELLIFEVKHCSATSLAEAKKALLQPCSVDGSARSCAFEERPSLGWELQYPEENCFFVRVCARARYTEHVHRHIRHTRLVY